MAEITDVVNVSGWPIGTRMLVRREQPHPGAQLRFTDLDGHRYQLFVTDLPDSDLPYLEALYRGRGRMECAIRDLIWAAFCQVGRVKRRPQPSLGPPLR